MRKLYIKRQRALACFGTAYHVVLNQSLEDHLKWAEARDRAELMTMRTPASLPNGGAVCLEIGEEPGTVFVAAYLEQRIMHTRLLPIPAGTEDLLCTVVTSFDGYRRLSLELVPGDPDAAE